ncbi:MAG: PilZ domain-containing protein [Candidatus Omnitrophota bacterium]|jgi:c-di-GMP-binding flagellar brake protein YcgR|nr:PilZ domain-containing protein [Candidatus Omnitrophota bacterium]
METRTDNMVEKRRFQRVDSNLPLRYKNLKTATVPMGSITRDIGAGGVSFKTNEFISLACRLVVEITLPTVQRSIKAISKVAWIRKLSSGEQYELGNQFLEISKEDRIIITDYVNRLREEGL